MDGWDHLLTSRQPGLMPGYHLQQSYQFDSSYLACGSQDFRVVGVSQRGDEGKHCDQDSQNRDEMLRQGGCQQTPAGGNGIS